MNDIKDALSRVADSSAPAPLDLDRVRGRARQIRRRRTATAIVGSAAAVAAIAGLGVAVMPNDSRNDSVPPATQTPSVIPSPSVAADPDAVGPVHHVRLDVPVEKTFNNNPNVPVWFDGEITDVDGSVTPFPGRPLTFAKDPTTGDWVVIEQDEGNAELVRIKPGSGKQVGAPSRASRAGSPSAPTASS